MTKIDLYRNIGYLSYALATNQNKHSTNSIKFMKNELIKLWYAVEKPNILNDDTDSYVQIELIFNWLLSHGMSSKFALKNFSDFIQKNRNSMSPSLKKTILSYSEALIAKLYPNEKSIPVLASIHDLVFDSNNTE